MPSQQTVTWHDDGEAVRELAAAARIARRLAAERRRDLLDESPGAVQSHPTCRTRRPELGEPLLDPGSRLRADPRHAVEPARRGGVAQLRERPDPERVPELAHALRGEPEQPADADELREHLVLQLAQLGQVAGLDELTQAGLDPGADSGELAHSARAYQR